jgi:hypothetical protein
MQAMIVTPKQRSEGVAETFIANAICIPGNGTSPLITVINNQAYFTKGHARLGILNQYCDWFEFIPGSDNVRAVVFHLRDGPDILEKLNKSMNEEGPQVWVPNVLNYASTNFTQPSHRTRALVEALVHSAPSLSDSAVLAKDIDYRNFSRGDFTRASVAQTQTLLVFVTVPVGDDEGHSVVRIARIRGVNLLCTNITCQYNASTSEWAMQLCRLCKGSYCCCTTCNLAATADHHMPVCSAIQAWHRAQVLKRRLPAVPRYIVDDGLVVGPAAAPEEADEAEAEEEPAGEAAAAAAVEEEQGAAEAPRMVRAGGEWDGMSTDDEYVDDTQPVDVENDFSVLLEAAAAAEEEVIPETPATTPAAARELFPSEEKSS